MKMAKYIVVTSISFFCWILLSSSQPASASGVTYSRAQIGSYAAHVVSVDLTDPNVRVTTAIARGGRGSSEQFSSMLHRTQPTAAITGAFFDPRTLTMIGDVILASKWIQKGFVG